MSYHGKDWLGPDHMTKIFNTLFVEYVSSVSHFLQFYSRCHTKRRTGWATPTNWLDIMFGPDNPSFDIIPTVWNYNLLSLEIIFYTVGVIPTKGLSSTYLANPSDPWPCPVPTSPLQKVPPIPLVVWHQLYHIICEHRRLKSIIGEIPKEGLGGNLLSLLLLWQRQRSLKTHFCRIHLICVDNGAQFYSWCHMKRRLGRDGLTPSVKCNIITKPCS